MNLNETSNEIVLLREKRFLAAQPISYDTVNKYTMEVLVVVDEKMQAYYGSNLKDHVLQQMSIVTNLFADPSFGNDMDIAVLDIVKLTDEIKFKPHQYVGKFLT